MKMENRAYHTLLYICVLAVARLLAPAPASADNVTVRTPGGLRVENATAKRAGSHLVVNMQLHFDDLRVRSNRYRAVVPVIRGRDGEVKILPAVLLTGRRQHYVYLREGNRHYPEARELRRNNGRPQSVDYLETVKYQDWMRRATLEIVEDSCGCGLNMGHEETPLLSLRNPEEALAGLQLAYVAPRVTETKTYTLEGRAYLDFPVSSMEIQPDYRNNPRELGKIIETIDMVRNDTNTTIRTIGIHGYASPDGSYATNERLSMGRAIALRDYVKKLYRFGNEVKFNVRNTPEDWAGLDSLVEGSNLDVKPQLLALFRNTTLDPDVREAEIRRCWPDVYRFMLASWYPALRHSDYVISYSVRSFTTPEEARRVYLVKPQQLSLNELYMVAGTYPAGSREFNEVFETAVRLYPADPVANLNAANIAICRRELDKAETHLAKAGQSPEAELARGAVALLRGDYTAARRYIEAARAGGVKEAAADLLILDELQ